MVKIVHYEVYIDKGNGWQLENRLPADQRQDAVIFAKANERGLNKVKIIKETFDVKDNTFQETVEYMGGNKGAASNAVSLATKKSKNPRTQPPKKNKPKNYGSATPVSAITKAVLIVGVCLLLVNFIVTLIAPIIEAYAPEDLSRTIIFAVFFVTFLSISIPLLLKKVPWYVFASSKAPMPKQVKEKKILSQADNIIKWYNINSNIEPAITTVFPDAPIEYKRDILSFLTEIISYVQSITSLKDSFSKLGVKLIIYGGCLELSRNSGLHIGQANSLLFEAFKIIDGKNADLEAFYEAKSSYKDNKVAVFLTGVGAYLMSQMLKDRPMDVNALRKSFEKWEAQNATIRNTVRTQAKYVPLMDEDVAEIEVHQDCWVNTQVELSFSGNKIKKDQEDRIRGAIRNIIYNLLRKNRGLNVMEFGDITSASFTVLNHALSMAEEVYQDIEVYKAQEENQDVIIHVKCAIVEASTDAASNLAEYAAEVLKGASEDSVIVTETLKNALDKGNKEHKFKFELLGNKTLNNSGKKVVLYRVIF